MNDALGSARFFVAFFFFFTISSFAHAKEELQPGKRYKLTASVSEFTSSLESGKTFTALRNSEFVVLSDESDKFTVQFMTIFNDEDLYGTKTQKTDSAGKVTYVSSPLGINFVKFDRPYQIPKKIISSSVSFAALTNPSITGLTAGPLVVPFKWRTDDKSLTGEATLGAYAGITFNAPWLCSGSNRFCFQITPLVSAGLTQVSVPNSSDPTKTDNKSGITIAAGFLLQNWSNINIGFVYGQDRIGKDQNWEHEGKGWLSFTIGWDLTADH